MAPSTSSPDADAAPALRDHELHEDLLLEGHAAPDGRLVEARLEDCRLRSCDLSGSTWLGVRLLDCELEGCDLSNLVLTGSRLRDVRFVRCKLMGVAWERAEQVASLRFEECKLDYGSFQEVDLSRGALLECSAREVGFVGTDLRHLDARGTDFTGSRFARADLRKADLRQARGYVIDPRENRLEEARFSLPEAVGLLEGLGIRLED